jgi:uroporphyrinogen decarboxylase
VVGLFERSFLVWDRKTMARTTGSFYDLVDDGHGKSWYMYRGPALPTPDAYDRWPYFPNTDDLAHKTFRFYKKMQAKFGDAICILGQASFGIHETMLWSFGFENMALFIRREPDLVRRFIALLEDIIMKTNMAMMDAGIKVVFDGDDFAYKSGPMLNPRLSDELFGGSYRRITDAVHGRGGKVLLHSCGDNTKLFDYFIKWGFDGGHAYENTSNVNIAYEKKTHGDQFTIVGGVGVDYILTPRSTPDEVREEVRRLIKLCAPGGRFIIGPVHDHPDMDMEKVRILLETVREQGK